MSTDQTSAHSGTEETNYRVYWLATILLLLLFWLITLSSMYLYWNGYMTGTHALSLILCPWLGYYELWCQAWGRAWENGFKDGYDSGWESYKQLNDIPKEKK